MFSGKSNYLLETYRELKQKNQKSKFLLVKPDIDKRFSDTNVVSRSGISERADYLCPIKDFSNVVMHVKAYDIDFVFIDEAQFFDDSFYYGIHELARVSKIQVYISGLVKDSNNKFFGYLYKLLNDQASLKLKHTELFTSCMYIGCDNPSKHNRRIPSSQEQIFIGDQEYKVYCDEHADCGE